MRGTAGQCGIAGLRDTRTRSGMTLIKIKSGLRQGWRGPWIESHPAGKLGRVFSVVFKVRLIFECYIYWFFNGFGDLRTLTLSYLV